MDEYSLGGFEVMGWVAAHWTVNYLPNEVKIEASIGRNAMSEEHDTNKTAKTENHTRPNRRRFMQLAGAGTLGLGGVPLASRAATEDELELNELTGNEKESTIEKAIDSNDYQLLMTALEEDGISTHSRTEKAYEMISNNEAEGQIAAFVVDNGNENIEISIAIPIGEWPAPAKASIIEYNDNGKPVEAQDYTVKDNKETTSTDLQTASSNSVYKNTEDLSDWEPVTEGSIQAQNSTDVNVGCSPCKEGVRIMNAVGCGAETAVACAVITSQTVIGPIACGAFVAAACFVIKNYGINKPSRVCNQMGAC